MDAVNNTIESGNDTISILITTDNHVGYKENDPIRGDDSWKSFQEVTQLAKHHDVDMLLHSGDLFHVNKPSKKSIYNVMKCLRLNCLGNRPCEMELLSDPSLISGDGFNVVNYEDPNINVSIPVFGISGNHDDATGTSLLLPMDLLSVLGLINHFGKVLDNEGATVLPILLQKGTTKLALYGMSSVKDERLFRMFRDGKVKFLRPNVQTDSWFNLACVHQNHFAHTKTSYLPEQFLPHFLDFVIWGHEHECIPNPVFNPETGFHTLQPGSSVATSLCEGEAQSKNVFILKIKGQQFKLEPIPLKTVRPFKMEEISLQQENFVAGPESKDLISRFLITKVEALIKEAQQEYLNANPELDDEDIDTSMIPLPLIRLRVDYSGDYEVEGPQRLSKKFVGKVANIDDIFQFHKKSSQNSKLKALQKITPGTDTVDETIASDKVDIQSLISGFLGQAELTLIPEQGIGAAVKSFLDKEDKNILHDYVSSEIKREANILANLDIDYSQFDYDGSDPKAAFKTIISQLKVEKKEKLVNDISDINEVDDKSKVSARSSAKASDKASTKPSTKSSTKASSKPSTRTRQKPISNPEVIDSDSMSDNQEPEVISLSSEDEYVPDK